MFDIRPIPFWHFPLRSMYDLDVDARVKPLKNTYNSDASHACACPGDQPSIRVRLEHERPCRWTHPPRHSKICVYGPFSHLAVGCICKVFGAQDCEVVYSFSPLTMRVMFRPCMDERPLCTLLRSFVSRPSFSSGGNRPQLDASRTSALGVMSIRIRFESCCAHGVWM